MAVDPGTLASVTAIEACQPPRGETCGICQEMVEDQAPNYGNTYDSSTADIAEMKDLESTPVIIKVYGPKHFFHTVCILRWWGSGEPMVNTCPMDRVVAYENMHDCSAT